MTGKLFIDGADAFTAYGVFVRDGGYAGLAEWPALKTVDSNDWPEEDGADVDLLDIKLAGKEFELSLCCVDHQKTILLFDMLSDRAYHTFGFADAGIEKELRLVSQPNTTAIIPLQVFTLQFADDEFLKGEFLKGERQQLIPTGMQAQGFEIDGVDLSEYGVGIVSGTLDSLMKAPEVKKNLSINSKNHGGVIYDGSNVCFRTKDAVLKCYLKAPSTEVFWHNYLALLHDLVQPYERTLHVAGSGEYYQCYYKSAKVSRFAVSAEGGVWCGFDITLCFVSARPGQLEDLLSAEDGALFVTEDSPEDDTVNEEIFFNVREYED